MTKGSFFRICTIVVSIFILYIRCLPERDNPYDPKSRYINYSHITGKVITKSGDAIADAQISLNLKDISKTITTKSDSGGHYELVYFYTIDQGDSAVVSTHKNAFAESQKSLSLGLKKSDTINFILDALPQFSDESIISYHEQFYYPGDIFSVSFSVNVSDADGPGDIDSVFIVIPTFLKSFALDYNPNNIFRKLVLAESLPEGSLENLIGTDCFFEVLSKSRLRTRSNPIRLNRIIYDAPNPIAPFEDTVSQNFYCSWSSVQFSFPFTYGVEIYYITEDWERVLAFSADTIHSTVTKIRNPVTLPTARYYLWRALVKDNFGNISKSIPCLFYLRQ